MGTGAGSGDGFNVGYVSSVHGILQVVEIILSLCVLICVAVADIYLSAGGGWALFVAIAAIIIVGILFLLNAMQLRDRFGAQFSLVELIICGIFALFYLIALIVEAVIASKYDGWYQNGANIAAAVFCALAFIVFAIHTILHLKRWRFSFSSSSTTTTSTTTTTTSAKA